MKAIPCEHASCCYNASCQAVFEYWKFANGDKWKEMVKKALEHEKKLALSGENTPKAMLPKDSDCKGW